MLAEKAFLAYIIPVNNAVPIPPVAYPTAASTTKLPNVKIVGFFTTFTADLATT